MYYMYITGMYLEELKKVSDYTVRVRVRYLTIFISNPNLNLHPSLFYM